jgi:antitoxin Phd
MIQTWQVQEAKNKLSRVIDNAISSGPQIITRRGVEVVIVLSYEEYKRITAARQSLSDFFRKSPLMGADMDLTRDESEAREDIQL